MLLALSRPSVAQIGGTAFILAAQNGHDKVVERLLAAKAEVNAADKVRDEARADQARPQPALRPAVTEHTGQSRARMLCQQDLVAGSLPPRRCAQTAPVIPLVGQRPSSRHRPALAQGERDL